jgi:ERCC4-type nuclease
MIFLDDRQGSGELYSSFSVPVHLCRLEFADMMFFGEGPHTGVSIGIERKKIHDLVDSISSGRLSAHQLIGLTNSYDAVYLVVEGPFRPTSSGLLEVLSRNGRWYPLQIGRRRFMYRDIIGYLNSAVINAGINVWRTYDPDETVTWTESVFKSWSKPWNKHTIFKRFAEAPLEKAHLVPPTVTRRMFKELSNVGWEKSSALEKEFPNMEKLLEATPKDIQRAPGIGKTIAQKIYQELRE